MKSWTTIFTHYSQNLSVAVDVTLLDKWAEISFILFYLVNLFFRNLIQREVDIWNMPFLLTLMTIIDVDWIRAPSTLALLLWYEHLTKLLQNHYFLAGILKTNLFFLSSETLISNNENVVSDWLFNLGGTHLLICSPDAVSGCFCCFMQSGIFRDAQTSFWPLRSWRNLWKLWRFRNRRKPEGKERGFWASWRQSKDVVLWMEKELDGAQEMVCHKEVWQDPGPWLVIVL